MAVHGMARVAQALGDRPTAMARYTEFLEIARRFVTSGN
jgi:hypothetical protein